MKSKNRLSGIWVLIIFTICSCTQQGDFPVLRGPYLGQKPPGMTPEIFAPGILNNDKMGAFCSVFSPDQTEFYFVHYERKDNTSGGLFWMKRISNIWNEPEMLPFDSPFYDNDMCMSADGNMLIFRSYRDLPNGQTPKNHTYLWFVERTENGWSEANPFLCGGKPVRTGYPSVSNNGTVYFASRQNGHLGIYLSRLVKDKYHTPELVCTLFNQDFIHGDMFVAPDEDYMIISGRDRDGKKGYGGLDLYIVFRQPDGSWAPAINMGKSINTSNGENCPQVSPDGKYFFFNRYNPEFEKGNIYWVDAKVIGTIKIEVMNSKSILFNLISVIKTKLEAINIYWEKRLEACNNALSKNRFDALTYGPRNAIVLAP